MKVIQVILALLPVPFLFHLYEYNSHLARQEAVFLFPAFLMFIIIVGIQLRRIKLPLLFGLYMLMTVISLILGNFFVVDDGSWFKPFNRDEAIVLTSVIYILGQLLARWISNGATEKEN